MIAIIDYGMGNLKSVEKAFSKLGAEVKVTHSAADIEDASRVVLPGVGAFGECIKNLEAYGLTGSVIKAAKSGKPFLGICLGLQLLFEESEEDGPVKGLGLIPGKVVRFKAGAGLKVPHIGWNSIEIKKESPLLSGIADGDYFYFVHSYHAAPKDPSVALTSTEYGGSFTSAVASGNIVACQFHPEKSQKSGLRILENFMRMN